MKYPEPNKHGVYTGVRVLNTPPWLAKIGGRFDVEVCEIGPAQWIVGSDITTGGLGTGTGGFHCPLTTRFIYQTSVEAIAAHLHALLERTEKLQLKVWKRISSHIELCLIDTLKNGGIKEKEVEAVVPITANTVEEFRYVPIVELVESRSNPRKTFDAHKLAELAESIRTQGILQPIVVRPHQKGAAKYEIVAGARRYRAAKTAGKDEVPCIVRTLSDDQVLELQVLENLQREDVHPLEEADGYKALLARSTYDVPAIAERIGKDQSYVYRRLQLTQLVEQGRKLFLEERIPVTWALAICRLAPPMQASICEDIVDRWSNIRTVDDLHAAIARELMDLAKAPFVRLDPSLPGGACSDCAKRSGAQPALWPEMEGKDCCTDADCYNAKVTETVARNKAEHPDIVQVSDHYAPKDKNILGRASYRSVTGKEAKSEEAKKALVVDGPNAGKLIKIVQVANRGYVRSDEEIATERKRKAEEERKQKVHAAQVSALVAAVPEKPFAIEELRWIAAGMWARLWNDHKRLVKKRRGADPEVETMDLHQVKGLIVEITLANLSFSGSNVMDEVADRWGVDLAAIEKAVRTEVKASKAAKKSKGAKKSAKKK